MAGRNLWHKPYFQPELYPVNKNASSKDRYLWETNYNHHLLRLQNIQSRPVHRPRIIKREYNLEDLEKLEAEKARLFQERTQLNTLPIDSRSASPAHSRQSSEVSGLNRSPGTSPRTSGIVSRSWPSSRQSLYTKQNYPTVRRSSKVERRVQTKAPKLQNQNFITDSETFFQSEVRNIMNPSSVPRIIPEIGDEEFYE